jgi:tetratricopeptide (TPR) repeat protein
VAHHDQDRNANAIGELFSLPASRVLDVPGAAEQPGYARALILAAWHSFYSGDYSTAEKLCQQALQAEQRLGSTFHGPRIKSDVHAFQAEASLSAGDYEDAVSTYTQAAELAGADGYPGLAAMELSYAVSTALLGGGDIKQATAMAEQSVALARQSGMPGAITLSLNALALTSVERDPARARVLLREVIERSSNPGAEIPNGYLTGCVVAGRLRDWDLTLALAAKTMYLYRWSLYPLQAATCLAECARAFADDEPEIAGALQGAAYAAFRRASPTAESARRSKDAPVNPNANFVLTALRETGDLVAAALGNERLRELRVHGAAMSMDEAIAYALAQVDPKLLTGRVTVGEKR